MKSLNLQLRFLAPLLVTLVAAAYFALPVMDRLTLRWFARDLNARGSLVTNTLSDSIGDAISDAKGARLQVLFDRVVQDERLFADRPLFARWNDDSQQRQLSAHPGLPGGASRCRAARPAPSTGGRSGPRRRAHGRQRDRADRQAGAPARHELHRSAQPGHAALPAALHRRTRPGHRADHGDRRAAQLARLGVRRSRPAARRRPAAADDGHAGNGAAGRRDPCPHARPGGRVSAGPGTAGQLGCGTTARAPANPAAGRPGHRRLEPGALHPRARPGRRSSSGGPPADW